MKKSKQNPLDFVIDKRTNSIENISTGEVFDTEIVKLTSKDINQINQKKTVNLIGSTKSKTSPKKFSN
jgi:hypothetical protein